MCCWFRRDRLPAKTPNSVIRIRWPDCRSAAKRPGAGVKLRAVSPEKLSEAIVRACERRRPELVYPPYMRILVALGQLSPRLGDWIVRRLT